MTAKEELHQLVDELADRHLEEARRFLHDLRASEADDSLDADALASLDRGLADIRAGRLKSLEDYERERGL